MKYSYEAYDTSGKRIADSMEANSTTEVTDHLRGKDLIPLTIREATGGASRQRSSRFNFRKPNDLKYVTDFCRQLSVLVGAGTPVVQALGAVERQQDHAEWQGVVSDIRQSVENGGALSTALQRHRSRFDVICQSLVAAGESSGQLQPMLDRLAHMTRQRQRVRNAVIGSLAYPCVLLIMAAVVLTAMIVFVMPRFAGLFGSLDAELPPSTKLLMDLSGVVRGYWWAIVPAAAVLVALFAYWTMSPSGRSAICVQSLKLPIIGKIVRSLISARIIRLLGTLIQSKVPLLESLDLCAQAAGNERYSQLVLDARAAVTDGEMLTTAFRKSPLISPTLVEAMDTGERTGALGPVLLGVADVLDEDNEIVIRSLSSIVEPIILIVLGLVVGFVAISMFLPLFDLTSATQGAAP